ncbi:hypothetical protein ABK040_007130 [Willaertia magna]
MKAEVIHKNIMLAAQALKKATCIYITAGPGMSVDSGLTREKEIYYKDYPVLKLLNITNEESINPELFENDPTFAHGFYCHRYNLYQVTQPHAGYNILKKFTQRMNNKYFIFTSCIDGHFGRIFPKNRIAECHGSIEYQQCSIPCCDHVYSVEEYNEKFPQKAFPLAIDLETLTIKKEDIPKCIHCGEVARPNILMTKDNDFLPTRFNQQIEEQKRFFLQDVNEKPELVVIEIGAGLTFPSVRKESERRAKYYGSTLIRINPKDYQTPLDVNTIAIPLRGLEALYRLEHELMKIDEQE